MTPAPLADVPATLARFGGSDRAALSFYRGKTLEGRLAYGELSARVERLAGALHQDLGVRPGDRVALLAPNRLEIPVLVLALLRLGAVVVPLNPASSPADWAYILGHSAARGLCVTRELGARVLEEPGRRFTLSVEDVFALGGATAIAPAPPEALGDRMGVVLYTSGTTGNPKGVALRQSSLCANAWSMAHNFGLDGTTQLAVLPLYHAHAFGFGLMTALSTGGHLVFTERLEPFTWAQLVRAESVEVTSVVPSLLPMLLAAGVTRDKVPSLRHIMVSSAPLAPDVAKLFQDKTQVPLVLGWGLSEYTNFACCVPPSAPEAVRQRLLFGWEAPSVGPALEGTEVRVVDATGVALGAGERGELVVRGHSTMLGYLGDPEATGRTIDPEGWLHTGDEGRFELEGGRQVFFVTGRLKEIIIRDAEKYSPLQLERALVAALPELSGKLVIVGFAHHEHGEEIGAYLELEAFDDALGGRLLEAIQTMPVPERPKVVLHGNVPVPRTHTGKIQRRKMQPWFSAWSSHRGALVIAALGGTDATEAGVSS
jgi:long-chain acyl-CoA synthetase